LPRAASDELERQILQKLESSKRKHVAVEDLAASLTCSPETLADALNALCRRGNVARTRKGRVALANRLGLESGRLQVGYSGRALVIPDEPDAPIAVARGAVRPAMHGDRVLVEVEPYTQRGLRTGTIREVLERRTRCIVGTIERPAGGPPILVPTDSRIGAVATLVDDHQAPDSGLVVVGRIVEYPTSFREPVVRIEEVLGPRGILSTEIESVCRTMSIPTRFGEQAEAEARALLSSNELELAGREDLRGELTLTIDPHDAKDHDDAVAIERTSTGYRLTVSIADVSFYVRPGSALDREAYERGTSVYFPGRCVPMLPEALSSNLASLRPDEDRLTVSVFVDIDTNGRVTATRFARSVIRSDFRLAYEDVQRILDGKTDESNHRLCQAIARMAECAARLHERRLARGAIDLDIPEPAIRLDEAGFPQAIERRPRLTAHRIIEEFMLAANEAVARELERRGKPFLYRVHEHPDAESLTRLAETVSLLGLRLEREGADASPAMLQALAVHSRGTRSERVVHVMILRALPQARYSAHKQIHFGLASAAYTHFTSPIRRYPDLVTHRALCALVSGSPYAPTSSNTLEPVADHCSSTERRAVDAERDIVRAAAILYMESRVGEVFEATVTGIQRYGFYVELDDPFVDGFVPVGRLAEYYDFVPERMELHARTSNDIIRIGRRMRVRLEAAELADRRLEFKPEIQP